MLIGPGRLKNRREVGVEKFSFVKRCHYRKLQGVELIDDGKSLYDNSKIASDYHGRDLVFSIGVRDVFF